MDENVPGADDQSTINRIQSLRNDFITELTTGGKLPKDKDERDALIKIMADASSTSLTRVRIKSDSAKAKSEQAVAAQIASLLLKVDPNKIDSHSVASLANPSLPAFDPLPGETEIGVVPVTYHSVLGDEAS